MYYLSAVNYTVNIQKSLKILKISERWRVIYRLIFFYLNSKDQLIRTFECQELIKILLSF